MAKMSESGGAGNFLKSKDLENGQGGHVEAKAQVESLTLTMVEFEGQNARQSWQAAFVGKDKVLDLNVTNRKFLTEDCGVDPDCEIDGPPWVLDVPLDVILFVVPTQKPDGSPTVGLRMRKSVPVESDVPF